MKVKASQQEGFVLLVIPEDITFQNCKSLKAQIEKALQVFQINGWFWTSKRSTSSILVALEFS